MQLRPFFYKILITVLLAAIVGAASAKPKWMNPQAPDFYTVKKGDTLWDIAGMYLEEPWRWPEIWAENQTIENPHLIYPGDNILLRFDANGQPSLHLQRSGSHQKRSYWENGQRVVRLSPKIRSTPAEGAIPTIPTRVIRPFFNRSRVISQEQVDFSPSIVALDEDHLVVGAGDRIYASKVEPENPVELYAIFRVDKTYQDPKSQSVLGIEGLILGKAQVELLGDPASLLVKKSYYEIRVGDKLIEPFQEDVDAFFYPKAPQGDPAGQIISVFDGLSQIGQYQAVVITGGHDHQRMIGDVLAVYQSQKDIPSRMRDKEQVQDFPSLKIGRLILFRVFDKVSYGLVMNATRPIYIEDKVGQP